MLKFILKKLLLMIPMLVVISLIVYLGLKSTGVDPISSMIPPEVISQNPELAEQMREELGFNDPVIVQYARWLGNIVRGDFGYTLKNEKIIDIIAARLPYTLELSVYAMLFSAVIGIGIGIISAIRQTSASASASSAPSGRTASWTTSAGCWRCWARRCPSSWWVSS